MPVEVLQGAFEGLRSLDHRHPLAVRQAVFAFIIRPIMFAISDGVARRRIFS